MPWKPTREYQVLSALHFCSHPWPGSCCSLRRLPVRVTTCAPEKRCHGLNVCVSPKLLWWTPNDSSDSVRSWDLEWCLGHEGGAFTNGINAFIEEALGVPSSLSSVWAHNERYTPWKRALTWLWWHPDLRVPGPRIGGGKFLLFFSCPLCDFCCCCYNSSNGLIQWIKPQHISSWLDAGR